MPIKVPKDQLIPVTPEGHMIHNMNHYAGKVIWIPNTEAYLTLTYSHYVENRNSRAVWFFDERGCLKSINMADFDLLVKRMVMGKISGWFKETKHGKIYFLKFLRYSDDPQDHVSNLMKRQPSYVP